jgi:hypothetical protein
MQIASVLDVPLTFFFGDDNKRQGEVESLLFLDSTFSLRLLRAYSAIADQAVQRKMVDLMETIAKSQEEGDRLWPRRSQRPVAQKEQLDVEPKSKLPDQAANAGKRRDHADGPEYPDRSG